VKITPTSTELFRKASCELSAFDLNNRANAGYISDLAWRRNPALLPPSNRCRHKRTKILRELLRDKYAII
jgi:hypothetical protein